MKKPLGALRLIELLVVISVSVRERARITQELSNLPELGIATQIFADLRSGSLSWTTSGMEGSGPVPDPTRFRWEP